MTVINNAVGQRGYVVSLDGPDLRIEAPNIEIGGDYIIRFKADEIREILGDSPAVDRDTFVRERNREALIDHVKEQDKIIRRRNETIADAEKHIAVLEDQLRVLWDILEENAEPSTVGQEAVPTSALPEGMTFPTDPWDLNLRVRDTRPYMDSNGDKYTYELLVRAGYVPATVTPQGEAA